MAELKQNTWTLNGWYEQTVAGTGSYSEDNTFWVWGKNNRGALGLNQGPGNAKSSPVQLPGLTWEKLGKGNSSDWKAVIKTDGTLWTWGQGGYGNLGQNEGPQGGTMYYSSPVQIGSGTDWNKVACADRHLLAIKTNGSLWTCGSNQFGQLGDGTADTPGGDTTGNSKSSPIQIPGTWTDVAGGPGRSYGIKSGGTMWSWGTNTNGGSLGHSEPGSTNISSPKQIPGTTWSKLATSSDNFTAAIKTDGTLWAWGNAQNTGNLGHRHNPNSGINSRSSPIQIPGTNWNNVVCNGESIWATKTDGTLWSWGNNDDGQLGHNERNPAGYSSPTQIGSNTNWSEVIAGQKCCFFKTSGNAVWVVGAGTQGQLGNNSETFISSPVLINSGAWSDISSGTNSVYGIRQW